MNTAFPRECEESDQNWPIHQSRMNYGECFRTMGSKKKKNPQEGGASPCSSIGGKLASHNNPVFTHKAPTLNKGHEWVLHKLSNHR